MSPDQTPFGSRKHMARAERERRMRRYITVGISITAVLVVALIGYGWVNQAIIFPGQTMAVVNGVEITNEDFQARVALAQLNLLEQYQSTQQLMAFFGGDAELQARIQQDLGRIEQQLTNPLILGQQVLESMIQDVIIADEAEELGIEVSEADVDQSIEEVFGFYPAGTPTPQATSTLRATHTPAPTEAAQTEQAPTRTPSPVPSATAVGTARPSATPYTQEAFEQNFRNYMNSLREYGISEQEYRSFVRSDLLREAVRDHFAEQVERVQEQVHARHILVEDLETAEQVLGRLEEGDSWDALAEEYSQDTSNNTQGGDLGWFARGRMVAPFESAAFEAQVGETVGPVESSFGFHIIQVLDRGQVPLSRSDYDQAVTRVFQEWLQEQRVDIDLHVEENWHTAIPTPPGQFSNPQ